MPNPARLEAILKGIAGSAPESKYIRAYHGSPRPTHFDKFDSRFIGTGEGAQMYSHGHYLAEAEPVAIGYRDRLSPRRDLFVGGEPIPATIDPDGTARVAALRSLRQAAGVTDDPILALRQAYSIATDHPDRQFVSKVVEHLNDMKRRGVTIGPSKGTMYEVEVRHTPDEMLDWDLPLSQQPEIMRRLGDQARPMADDGYTGYNVYDWLTFFHGSPQRASDALVANYGIPGVKYLDYGSRGNVGDTRNFVVFPKAEDSIRILRKYGVMAPIPMAAGAATMDE